MDMCVCVNFVAWGSCVYREADSVRVMLMDMCLRVNCVWL
jgi:hypothetical protein